MCSIVDGAMFEKENETEVIKTVCQKCKTEKPFITLRKKDVYCKNCFLINCNHKFRSTLGKNKAIKINDSILVAFSGSQGSLAVLKLIRNSFDDANNPKKITYHPSVLIIDESGIDEKMDFQIDQVKSVAQKFNFPVHVVHLSKALVCDETSLEETTLSNANELSNLKKVLTDKMEETSKESLLNILRMRLILKMAETLNCSKVFTSENADKLAIRLLSGVAIGRGAQVANEAGFCDFRHQEVQILRPLREFSSKEIALFNQHCGSEVPVTHEIQSTKENSDFCINKLTEKFVTGLQEGFPSTVPTIFRTGDKLLMEPVDDGDKCVLCNGFIDTEPKICCTALEAAQFSKLVSEQGPKGLPNEDLTIEKFNNLFIAKVEDENKENCGGTGEGLCSEGVTGSCRSKCSDKDEDYSQILCYSCSNLTSDIIPLPLKEYFQRIQRQKAMKSEINEFLL